MVYNLKRLSLTYTRGFQRYLKEHGIDDWTPEQRYNLLSYSLSKVYGLETAIYAKGTSVYGRSCTKFLSELKGTPKRIDKISFAQKVEVLSMVQGLYVTAIVLSSKKKLEVVGDGT